MPITNEKLRDYKFLAGMYRDGWFPNYLVDKVRAVLVRLCERIESEKPQSLDALYACTHAATEEINALQEEFEENESEIETVARECIGTDFSIIAKSYGFKADDEELIGPRDW